MLSRTTKKSGRAWKAMMAISFYLYNRSRTFVPNLIRLDTLAQYASAATWHVFCMVKAFGLIIWDTRKEYWLKLIVISLKAGAICSCNISFTLSIKTGARPFEKFFKCHLWIVDEHTSTVKVEPM